MLTPTQQIDQLRYIAQALDYIEPALREVEQAGHRVMISVSPAYTGSDQIRLQMFESSAELADAAGLATLLGWTENAVSRTSADTHHRWHGVLKGFSATLAFMVKHRPAVDDEPAVLLPGLQRMIAPHPSPAPVPELAAEHEDIPAPKPIPS